MAVIIFISFVIGTSISSYEIFSNEQFFLIKLICSIYFVFEITIRYFGHSVWDSKSIVGDKFSYTGIYIDAFVIFIAFLPYTFASNLLALRIFRIFAHPQITKFVPNIAISNFSIIRDTGIKILYVTGIIIALTYIYGVGPKIASDLCDQASVDKTKRVNELNDEELNKIRELIDNS